VDILTQRVLKVDTDIITRASVGKPKSKGGAVFLGRQNPFQEGSMETGDEYCDSLLITFPPFVNNIIYRKVCFVKKALERIMLYTDPCMFTSLANAHASCGRSTQKDVECFWNG